MNTLHLTLKRQWFDMILSGEKKEEYREIKQYWIDRLTWHEFHQDISCVESLKDVCYSKDRDSDVIKENYYDKVIFSNGYSKDARKTTFEVKFITYGLGRPEWGAMPNTQYFVIKLGKRL